MVSTTLMTFLVRTPPTTRSVGLYGSWDNFARPYPMQRDIRIGPEHWSGCHSFSNIICDGSIQPDRQPREGGLKMGGTYWYYYKLDDDIEFHNASEPSTTICPLLPGQLVNVLHVPFALSSGRPRNTSTSSTGSERRTMNPDDKFINPRPVPQPQLPRLNTSPTLVPDPWSTGSSPVSLLSGRSATSGPSSSQPSSGATLRMFRIPRHGSFETSSRPSSPPVTLSGGIKSAFRSLRSSRPASPDTLLAQENNASDLSGESANPRYPPRTSSAGRSAPISTSSREPSPGATQYGSNRLDQSTDLVLRRPTARNETSPDGISYASFQQHRRQRSQSREPSSLRNSLLLDDPAAANSDETVLRRTRPLDTLKEIASAQNTPGLPLTAKKTTNGVDTVTTTFQVDLEKRLPTLPNTPSSAYPPSGAADRLSEELANLESHFSSTTIDTDISEDRRTTADYTHFSDWSSQYVKASPTSMCNDSIIDERPMSELSIDEVSTPQNVPDRQVGIDFQDDKGTSHQTMFREQPELPSTFSCSTISSTASSSLSTSPVVSHLDDEKWDKIVQEGASRFDRYQHYRLPAQEHGSEATLKPAEADELALGLRTHKPSGLNVRRQESISQSQPGFPHTTSMQQLLSDLSYLSEVIHQR